MLHENYDTYVVTYALSVAIPHGSQKQCPEMPNGETPVRCQKNVKLIHCLFCGNGVQETMNVMNYIAIGDTPVGCHNKAEDRTLLTNATANLEIKYSWLFAGS